MGKVCLLSVDENILAALIVIAVVAFLLTALAQAPTRRCVFFH
jgi:hypothetical protein